MSKDLFSGQAETYARYRPTYPTDLIEYLLQLVVQKLVAWDCATGNGQAALLLADHFQKVFATDISSPQLQLAMPYHNIEYLNCPAEKTLFEDDTFDLITVAQAYHWFNFEAFEKEARRVGKPGAVIAVWGYNLVTIHNPAVDAIIKRFYTEIVGPYWDAERKFVEEAYQTVPFGFSPLPAKDFFIHGQWLREDLIGYLHSWSSVRHFIRDKNYDPLSLIVDDLALNWKKDESKQVSFPVFVRIGRV